MDEHPGNEEGVDAPVVSGHERGPSALEPMTAKLMARLFVVPAIVVSVLLAVAIVVVLFGASSIAEQRTVTELLDVLEQGSGRRQIPHMLLPTEKEYWQAAQELSRRLAHQDEALLPQELRPTAERIISILDHTPPGSDGANDGADPRCFLMMALARLETPSAVQPLVKRLASDDARIRCAAVRALAEMHGVPTARQAVGEILPLLDDPDSAVRLVTCAAVASLSDRGNAVVIGAVSRQLSSSDRETRWNAATTLARLGSAEGKFVLMNMLDREVWESIDLAYEEDGTLVRRKCRSGEVSRFLATAADAASHVDDPELAAMIDKLCHDAVPAVSEAARTARERIRQRRNPGTAFQWRGRERVLRADRNEA